MGPPGPRCRSGARRGRFGTSGVAVIGRRPRALLDRCFGMWRGYRSWLLRAPLPGCRLRFVPGAPARDCTPGFAFRDMVVKMEGKS